MSWDEAKQWLLVSGTEGPLLAPLADYMLILAWRSPRSLDAEPTREEVDQCIERLLRSPSPEKP